MVTTATRTAPMPARPDEAGDGPLPVDDEPANAPGPAGAAPARPDVAGWIRDRIHDLREGARRVLGQPSQQELSDFDRLVDAIKERDALYRAHRADPSKDTWKDVVVAAEIVQRLHRDYEERYVEGGAVEAADIWTR